MDSVSTAPRVGPRHGVHENAKTAPSRGALIRPAASLTLARKEDSTKAVADRMAKSPATTVPQTPLPNVTYAVGGVTIMAGGTAIGGIGVSGAPGGQFDEECARAAIAKIQERMK